MPRIVTIRSRDESNKESISLVLSQDAISVGPSGDPWSGVTLSADQARTLAGRLSALATELENQEEAGYRTSNCPLGHMGVVGVVHDGSLQGHRAFQTALELARRPLASLDLIGVFGICGETGEASGDVDDYEWQKGWLTRLVGVYSEEAASAGVSLQSSLFAASDPCRLLDTLRAMPLDLIVIPKRVVRFGIHGERLLSSMVSRPDLNVLVCP